MIILDASLFVALLLNEADRRRQSMWEHLAAKTVLVPAHWPNEVANALRKAVRTKRLGAKEIAPIAQRVGTFDIRLAPATAIEGIGQLAVEALEHDLSVYDVTCVRLASAHQAPLATVDRAMRRAAQRMQVSVLPASLG